MAAWLLCSSAMALAVTTGSDAGAAAAPAVIWLALAPAVTWPASSTSAVTRLVSLLTMAGASAEVEELEGADPALAVAWPA